MTKAQGEMMERLMRAGFSWSDANTLRRIAMTLHRWAERECGNDAGCISRDEATGKPYWESSWGGKPYPIPDREAGALRRLAALLTRYPGWTYYHQGDPRGAALYLLAPDTINPGESVESLYTRGIAVF